MHRVTTVVLSVICVALLGVATNVATGALPDRWSPYLWLAWPLLLLLVLALVAVEVIRSREPRQMGAPATARARRVLLERVRRYWVTSVLERSLHEEARIELGIAATADDRRHPWALQATRRDGFAATLDDRASMYALFDELDRAVVILGAPGSGKTTTLLELARDLLDRAEADPDAPIPVVLNLSSWPTRRLPLARWLTEQLGERYGIPPAQSAAWVDAGELLPLLDGLDEVAEEHRDACVQAIADFHHSQPLTPLAVCCRLAEYEQLGTRLPVYGTVTIQPLDRARIERYVERAGLAGLRSALAADPGLWDLADSPLLLSIMALAYADDADVRTGPTAAGTGSGRSRLFSRYVEVMLNRRPHRSYSPAQTRSWLTTLADELRQRQQTVFVLDLITEGWSPRYGLMPTAQLIAHLTGLLGLSLVLAPAGWWLGGPAGLVTAAGLVAVTQVLYADQHSNLWSLAFSAKESDPVGGLGWLSGVAIRLAGVFVDDWATVFRIAALSVTVGIGATLVDGGPSWEVALGYGAGFFMANLIAFVAVDEAQMILYFEPPAPGAGRRELPSPMLRQRLAFALGGAAPIGTATGCLAGVFVAAATDGAHGVRTGALVGLGAVLMVLTLMALAPMLDQWLVRRRLARQEILPHPLLPFLGHAVQCLLLRQVGDGHIFVHRELLDHFADRAQLPEPRTTTGLAEDDLGARARE
ncbi:NACHT domain-containing protein [Micromonospora sp. RHAY321]|uniref:NACHT domain-containing protein n=1 Tax=Micromonospora sp. RHAY321 TaxID=2944807 RepID=UPI00207C8B94|nr:NACHT domain-containing protein [Micromonospora sp. RHAY321]MCO1596846.1 NACHT domain-containing protein [Micromonospora sp. RHAY321]